MGGRIDDIEVSESDPNIIYIGYAVGGVFKSENNGVSFEPVFETYGTASIGDIAIHPTNPNIVYVGTGEPNNRQTVVVRRRHLQDDRRRQDVHEHRTEGDADDRAHRDRSEESRDASTSRRPAICSARTPSAASTRRPTAARPGTRSSSSTRTPASPTSRSIRRTATSLYAASYQRRRSGCCFNGGGPGSAHLEDARRGQDVDEADGQRPAAGHLRPHRARRLALESERRLRADRSGRNRRARADAGGRSGRGDRSHAGGRGGGDAARGGAGPVQRARLDGQAAPGQPGGAAAAPEAGGGGAAVVRLVQQRRSGEGLSRRARRRRRRPRRAAAAAGWTPPALDPKKGGVFRSDNKGQSWTLVSNCNARPMYFSQLRVDPTNDKTIYVAGLPVAKSLDGGKTFATLDDAGGNGDRRATSISTRSGSIRRTRSTS